MKEQTPASAAPLENNDPEMVQQGVIKLLEEIERSGHFFFKFSPERIRKDSLDALNTEIGRHSSLEDTSEELRCRFYAFMAITKYQEIRSRTKMTHKKTMELLNVDLEEFITSSRIMSFIVQTINKLGANGNLFAKK